MKEYIITEDELNDLAMYEDPKHDGKYAPICNLVRSRPTDAITVSAVYGFESGMDEGRRRVLDELKKILNPRIVKEIEIKLRQVKE